MKYYAVRSGRNIGVYTSWSDCESQVKGYRGNQYKSFNSQAEALAYANGGSGGTTSSTTTSSNSYSSSKRSNSKPSSAVSPYPSNPPSHSRPIIHSLRIPTPSNSSSSSNSSTVPTSKVQIYTDGASKNNQARKHGLSRAGYGVYYGPSDRRNHSGRVTGEQTNQRGELQAIAHALEISAKESCMGICNSKTYVINTDSKYSIDAITNWGNNWEKNGWKTSTGTDVVNRDLIQKSRSLIREIKQNNSKVEFVKVKGHSGNHGNDMADKLAVEGCLKD